MDTQRCHVVRRLGQAERNPTAFLLGFISFNPTYLADLLLLNSPLLIAGHDDVIIICLFGINTFARFDIQN